MASDTNSNEDRKPPSPWQLRHRDVSRGLPRPTHAVTQHVSPSSIIDLIHNGRLRFHQMNQRPVPVVLATTSSSNHATASSPLPARVAPFGSFVSLVEKRVATATSETPGGQVES